MAVGKRSIKRALQKVLGRGTNVNEANPLEVHDAKVGSLISYEGTTTADGAADGSTLIDSVLTSKPDYDGNLVIITSGAYAGQGRDINGATTGGTVTPAAAFGGQILRGTNFVIVALRLTPAEVAAIEAKLDHAEHGLAALKDLLDALEDKVDAGVPKLYVEQIPDTDVNETVTDAEADCVLVNLAYIANRTYCLRYLRLKCADPGAQTVTIRLYERWNDAIAQLIDSFDIDSSNYGTYHSLMDIFSVPEIHSDAILIRAVHDGTSPGDDVAIEVTYRHAVATT